MESQEASDEFKFFRPNPDQLPNVPEEKKPEFALEAPDDGVVQTRGDYYLGGQVAGGNYYVVPAAPVHPIIRPLRQAMWDKIKLIPGYNRYAAFHNNLRFDDGDMKTIADTNMTLSGMLGTPLEYDLKRVSIHPSSEGEEYCRRWERLMSSGGVLKFILGMNNTILVTPLVLMTPSHEGIDQQHLAAPDELNRLNGTRPMARWAGMTTPQRQARRITSTETFHVQVELQDPLGMIMPNFTFYVVMHGTLYTTIF